MPFADPNEKNNNRLNEIFVWVMVSFWSLIVFKIFAGIWSI
jgi:hypothetical protein